MWWWSERGYRPVRFLAGDDDGGGGGGDDDSGDDDSGKDDKPTFDPITSQDDFDRMVKDRIKRAEDKARKDAATATRKQIEDETAAASQKEQGKFQELYEAEQKKVVDLQKEIETLKGDAAKRDLDAVRAAMAKKYGIPEKMASRLVGDDEAAIEADAKAVAKDLGVEPPDTEGGSTKKATKKKGADSGGTYTFGSATRRVPFPDKVKPNKE